MGRTYDKGIPPPNYPPAITLGNAECLENGEKVVIALADKKIVGGYPCACWTSQGLPCPEQIPWLWLNEVGLPDLPFLTPVSKWKDNTVYGNDAVQTYEGYQPTLRNDGLGSRFVGFARGQYLQIPPLLMGPRFSTFVVFQTYRLFPVPLEMLGLYGTLVGDSYTPLIKGNIAQYTDTRNNKLLNVGPLSSVLTLLGIRRNGNKFQWRFNATLGPKLALNPAGVTQFDYVGGQTYASGAYANNYIFEVIVYPDELSDEQDASVAQYLIDKYAL